MILTTLLFASQLTLSATQAAPRAPAPVLSSPDAAYPVAASPIAAAVRPARTDSTHCTAAAVFLRGELKMIAEIEADTIDDWRSGREVEGCRITAVGGTTIGVNREAVRFYERVRAAGWARTPDPRDAPNEASLRFRWNASDCLFNVNREAMLFTDAEDRVNEAFVPKPGEERYHVFVMCLPVLPAKPRQFSFGARLHGGALHVAEPERRQG